MESVEEAIAHYTERKSKSELSLSEIRNELTNEGKFSTAEISKICRTISDDELSGLKKEKTNPAQILHHPAVAFVLVALFGYLIWMAYWGLEDLWARGSGAPGKIKIWRYALMIGAIFFFIRNVIRVINYFKKK